MENSKMSGNFEVDDSGNPDLTLLTCYQNNGCINTPSDQCVL